uniref:C-type lectin domain-containing protein n=1 Tax=Timema bartmani TaxID=61472 RepID=A0A7R9EZU6_9NEOP|nr:unnamed protein product [Timema bartmani]
MHPHRHGCCSSWFVTQDVSSSWFVSQDVVPCGLFLRMLMLPLTGAVLSLLYTLMSCPCTGKKAPLYEIIPGQGLYKLHQKKSNWMSAWSTCLEEDAHLLIVNSKKEADSIVRIMKDNNVFEVFIGFHEDTTSPERSYVTVDGPTCCRQEADLDLNPDELAREPRPSLSLPLQVRPVAGNKMREYLYWKDGYTTPAPDLHCGLLTRAGYDVGHCEGQAAFVCEKTFGGTSGSRRGRRKKKSRKNNKKNDPQVMFARSPVMT